MMQPEAGAGTASAWRWHHDGYVVADLDAAIGFYRETLGFEVVFEVRDLTDLIQSVLGVPGLRCSLAQLRSPIDHHVLEFHEYADVPADVDPTLPLRPAMGHSAFLVEDLPASLAALEAAGGSLCGRITTFAEGRGIYVRTPVGTVVELLEAPADDPDYGPGDDPGTDRP